MCIRDRGCCPQTACIGLQWCPGEGHHRGDNHHFLEATMSFALTLSSLITPALIGAAPIPCPAGQAPAPVGLVSGCLLYTSDAADERSSVDLGGRRIIKKKK